MWAGFDWNNFERKEEMPHMFVNTKVGEVEQWWRRWWADYLIKDWIPIFRPSAGLNSFGFTSVDIISKGSALNHRVTGHWNPSPPSLQPSNTTSSHHQISKQNQTSTGRKPIYSTAAATSWFTVIIRKSQSQTGEMSNCLLFSIAQHE